MRDLLQLLLSIILPMTRSRCCDLAGVTELRFSWLLALQITVLLRLFFAPLLFELATSSTSSSIH